MLAALLAGWSFLAHPAAPAAPAMAGMVLAGIAAWVGGGWLARSYREAPGVAVVALVTVAMLAGGTESLSGGATAPPLGYANASAALLTIGVAGALSAAAHARDRLRTGLVVWAGVLAVASLATGSRAVAACCVLLMLLWPRLRRGPAAAWQAFAATVVGAAVVATVLLGATGSSSAEAGVVPETVGSTRVDLWSEALDITADHPVRGVGPGNFSLHSPTAGSDPDLQWAHSTPMQVLAELGLVGLALLAALTGWMVLALGRGAVFLAILALQPTVDYVLTFPAVLLGAAFVLGSVAATGVGRPGYLPVQRVSSSP
ncbi:MAG TPA: O-antigen ligase family protein [Nocardioidaceae bacterium]|nr:O-antigen ligase family protein [Nocardioidaceae bacterium]